MKKVKILSLGLLFFSAALMFSCSRERSAHVGVWWGEQMAENLTAGGYKGIAIYIDGVLVDSKTADIYWTKKPNNCDDMSDVPSREITWEKADTKEVIIKVEFDHEEDDFDVEIKDTIIVEDGDCLFWQLGS